MKIKYAIFGLLLTSSGVWAQAVSPLSPSLYYEMGGGVQFNRPLAEAGITTNLELGIDLDLPLSCDIWDRAHLDPRGWVDLIDNYVDDTLNELGTAVVIQLTRLGQGIAVAALQRALPGLYDYSQNLTGQIEAKIGVAKRSCEQIVNDIDNGINPLDPWKRIGAAVDWRVSLQEVTEWPAGADPATSRNILEAQEVISSAANNGTQDIPWFGGVNRGGPGVDNAIMVTEDLVKAGYNLQSATGAGVDLAADITAPTGMAVDYLQQGNVVTGNIDSRLSELFTDTEEAVEWATRFLGEQKVHICEGVGCESEFTPGMGLTSMLPEEMDILNAAWVNLIANVPAPTVEQMQEVSSGNVIITPMVYGALLRFRPQDQDLYIGRLISDVAVSRTVEKALAIRKMIMSSSDSPVVKGYTQASSVADELLDTIRSEIDDLMWGLETQNKLASNVAGAVLSYDALRSQNGRSSTVSSRRPNVVNPVFDRPVLSNEQ